MPSILKGDFCIIICLLKFCSLTLKLKEKDEILRKMKSEFEESEDELKSKLIEKDMIIDNLQRDLDHVRCEKNESVNKMHNFMKEIGIKEDKNSKRFSLFNFRKGSGGVIYYYLISIHIATVSIQFLQSPLRTMKRPWLLRN